MKENYIQLTDEYRLHSDGRLNLILHEKYEKHDGKGRNANPTGEFDFRPIGYFRNLEHVANYLVNLEVYRYEGSELEGAVDRIEKLSEDIRKSLKENIGVKWLE